jgi:ABC-type antimicrobial peptide transport system permease subunit
MPLLAGRDFTWHDDSRASRVVIVSRSVATALFGTTSALGARIRLGDGPRDQEMEIVGIAADAKIDDIRAPTVMAAYVPLLQTGDDVNWKAMLIRAGDGVTPSESSLSNALAAFGHEYVDSVRTFDRLVDDDLLLEREVTVGASAAAAVALALVIIGVYGLWTLLVLQRRKEMGIRLALGAGGRRVALLVMTGGLRIAGAGMVIGGIGAVFASQVLRSFVTGVSLFDPLSLALAPALVLLASAAACLVPAWRAASADPLTSLRAD